jgi:histone-lysine N-methyltransferase SETMAR
MHHDNAPAHTALSVREFLATKQIIMSDHPAYSPDLAPSDFFLFPKYRKYRKEGILMTLMTSGVIQQQL